MYVMEIWISKYVKFLNFIAVTVLAAALLSLECSVCRMHSLLSACRIWSSDALNLEIPVMSAGELRTTFLCVE